MALGNIDVSEESMTEVEKVDVLVVGDKLIMTLNGRPFTLDRERAVEAAFTLCSKVASLDRMRELAASGLLTADLRT